MINHIAVCVDGSEVSLKALTKAVELANDLGATLSVIEVVETFGGEVIYFGYPGYYQIPVTSDNKVEEIANKRLNELLPALDKLSGAFHRKVLTGSPVSEILNELEKSDYDLAIAGSHGRSFAGRFFMGSVSERLAQHAKIPVLIVR